MESQFSFERQEGQFDIPPPGIEPGNLGQWQNGWITDIGEVLPQFASLLEIGLVAPHICP